MITKITIPGPATITIETAELASVEVGGDTPDIVDDDTIASTEFDLNDPGGASLWFIQRAKKEKPALIPKEGFTSFQAKIIYSWAEHAIRKDPQWNQRPKAQKESVLWETIQDGLECNQVSVNTPQ